MNIFSMFQVCFYYNVRNNCEFGSKCPRLHICNRYIQYGGNCPKGGRCKKNHNFRLLKIINMIPLFQLWNDQRIAEFIRKCSPNACEKYLTNECLKDEKCSKVSSCYFYTKHPVLNNEHVIVPRWLYLIFFE